jgi:hypothetical protein
VPGGNSAARRPGSGHSAFVPAPEAEPTAAGAGDVLRPARAEGARAPFAALPDLVVAWLEAQLGSTLAAVVPQSGGMSPGPAVRLVTESGERAFFKACGSRLNPDTPELFRHEVRVLSGLDDVPYRASLLATYDDGDWVGLLLQDVEGRHPDLGDSHDRALVADLVAKQSAELTPVPDRVPSPTLADNARIWAQRWQLLEPFSPPCVRGRFPELAERDTALADRLPLTTLCHWDIREDNLLVQDDGQVVVVDWGMSRIGPRWADHLLLALTHRDPSDLRSLLDGCGTDSDLVVDTVLGLAGSQLVRSQDPTPPGLPTIRRFQHDDGQALFASVRPFV